MSNNRQILLGAFFLGVLLLLGWYTLFLTDFSLFGEKHELVVRFPAANGLRQGDSVLVAGMRQGRVKELTYDPSASQDRRITVTLLMDQDVGLREGFSIAIQDATLLGGREVSIDPGPAEGPQIGKDTVLFGTVRGNALADLGRFVEENRDAAKRIFDNVDAVVANVREGHGVLGMLTSNDEVATKFSDGVDKIQATFDNTSALTADLRAGKGVLGRLFTDEDLAGKLQEIADRLATITADFTVVSADLKDGKGALGRILKDEEMGEDLAQAMKSFRATIERINNGEGTLGRLIVDDTMGKDLQEIIARFKNGEGTLGKLFTNDEIYVKLAQVADDFERVSQALRNAEGTLGKVMMDPELYNEMKKALGLVTRSLEEYREAAPITTFTSVLFGGF